MWLSNTKPTIGEAVDTANCTQCAQYEGTLPLGGAGSVNCTAVDEKFTYVIVQSSQTENKALCLSEVEVYGGKLRFSFNAATYC